MTTAYCRRFADFYDLFYADKPYTEEAEFVDRCLRQYGKSVQRVIELACGTGRHACELAARGYDIVGVDISDDMIEVSRERAQAAGGMVAFRQGDMRNLQLEGPAFDAAVCLFDSIGYVQTNEAVGEVFAAVRRLVKPGGLLLIEFWHAAAMIGRHSPLTLRRRQTPDAEIVRLAETTLDYSRQLAHVDYTLFELRRDGTYDESRETHVNRYFLVQEMAALLEAAGLEPVRWFAGYSESEAISNETFHVLSLSRIP